MQQSSGLHQTHTDAVKSESLQTAEQRIECNEGGDSYQEPDSCMDATSEKQLNLSMFYQAVTTAVTLPTPGALLATTTLPTPIPYLQL